MTPHFARVLVALTLIALPASALASTKGEAKAEKSKHETKAERSKHGHAHAHAALAKKEPPTKKAKHRAPKAKLDKGIAASRATKAP
ncbi:MAG TPA: hypothetical protein VER11_03775 [Polyangiaceae bacterium]|nr:hypothetical protein [Polyangiaceae bacterium]